MILTLDKFSEVWNRAFLSVIGPPSGNTITNLSGLLAYLDVGKLSELRTRLQAGKHRKTKDILDNPHIGRLAWFPDGAGKLRYIAIGN